MSGLNVLIKRYFSLGMNNNEILALLLKEHNLRTSIRTLKRRLKELNLYRRKQYSCLDRVITFLREQISRSGQLHGYRWMHLRCIQHGLTVKQETVRIILKAIDPLGVKIRKRKRLRRRQYCSNGPNYLWHIDSYDKLKPYGIAINGCIDGFSRYVLWLKAGHTSSNPKVIAGYYINTVIEYGGIPRTIRTDMGTENVYIQQIQSFLRRNINGDVNMMPAFLCGTSTSNQRIESWWAILRKHNAQFCMNLFSKLKDDGYFGGTDIEKSLMQFCFLKIIQEELDDVTVEWNTHNITSSRNSIMPRGKPIIMFYIPEIYHTHNYMIPVSEDEVDIVKEYCVFLDDEMPCDPDVFELCQILLSEAGLEVSRDPYDAINIYMFLRNKLSDLIF